MKDGKFEIDLTMGGGNALLENHKLIGLSELEQIEKHAIERNKGSKYPAYILREDVEAVIEELAQKRMYEPFPSTIRVISKIEIRPAEDKSTIETMIDNETDAAGRCFSDADPGL